jgi:hypothetical protein
VRLIRDCFESAAAAARDGLGAAALMTAKSLIRQPWHTEYCHLWFELSDLRANGPTHGMLTLTLPAAVKTGRPLFLMQNAKGKRQKEGGLGETFPSKNLRKYTEKASLTRLSGHL